MSNTANLQAGTLSGARACQTEKAEKFCRRSCFQSAKRTPAQNSLQQILQPDVNVVSGHNRPEDLLSLLDQPADKFLILMEDAAIMF